MTNPRLEPTTDIDRWFRPLLGTGNDQLTDKLGQAGQAWLDAGLAFNRSTLSFLQDRLRDDLDNGRRVLDCRDPGELFHVQSAWSMRLVESCTNQWLALMGIGWGQLEAALLPTDKPTTAAAKIVRETEDAPRVAARAA